ncbi:MAG: M56 family metallopeptidase [Bacteroidota bacterium]
MEFLHQYISEELIYALGWTVLHSLWQGLLVALIMAFLFQALREKSARIRYEIASLSLFAVFLMALSTFIILYDSVEQHSLEAILTGEFTLLINISGEGGFLQETIQQSLDYFNQYLPLIVSVWLLGAAFFSLRLLGGLAYVQHLKYNNNELLPAFWQKQMDRLSAKLRLKKRVDLLESNLVSVPMVIGFFKPAILIPIGAINALNEKEVEAILAHELAHILRNDYFLNILFSIIEVLFYYHPAVWWISANLRLERENCCDDIAVKLCGNSLTYAKALVRLQEMNAQQSIPQFAMPFFGEKNQLLNRVKRILNQPQNRSNIMEKLTATCLLLFGLTFFSINAKTPVNQHSSNLFHFWESLEVPQVKANITAIEEEVKRAETIEKMMATAIGQIAKTINPTDTLPDRKRDRHRIVKTEDDRRVEITLEDGIVQELIIDGASIPNDQMDEYEQLIASMMEEFSSIPAPPAPPAPPGLPAPPAPPSPPGLSDPSGLKFRHEQGRLGLNSTTTVTTQEGENGETIVIIDGDNGEPMEIIMDPDQTKVISIDGDLIQVGDTAFIVDELFFPGGHHMFFNHDSNSFPSDITVTKDGFIFAPGFSVESWDAEELKELMNGMTEEQSALAKEYRERVMEWKEEMAMRQSESQAEMRELRERRQAEMRELRDEMKEKQREYREQMREQMREQREEQKRLSRELREKYREQQNRDRESIREIENDRRQLHTDISFDGKGHFDAA